MRFREFKIIKESQAPQIYTIGDSHAEGMAYNKGFINKANGGQPSTSQTNFSGTHTKRGTPVGLAEVPEGSVIVVAQGANDTANSAKAFVKSKGKIPLVPPATIAANVAKVVNAAKAKGQVIFVLFPNGNGRAPGIAEYYSGDYQEEVRKAIKSAVGVPVVDLEGKGLAPDGIHGTPGAYKAAGAEVLGLIKNVPQSTAGGGTQPAKDSKTANDSKPGEQSGQLAVPSGRTGTEVADIQKVLIKLGYELPQHGVDGIRGPETSAAVSAFQKDNGLTVDGDPGPDTVAALNKVIASKGITFDKSTAKDVKAGEVGPRELAPLAQDAVTKGKVGKVLDFIAGPESGGHYDIMMGGKREPAILKMTVAELLNYQRQYKASGAETAAAGRYQYMPGTLRDYCKRMGVNIEKQTFDPKFQDELAIYTMRFQCKLDGWLSGKVDDGTFLNLLAQVWAGIPKTSGQSAYQGVGSNKAGVKADVALNKLQDIRQA
jgi:peptidoglycan hydrolase-like protein with peptidoglycan-binding domain/muramidase (phage lysozyme)